MLLRRTALVAALVALVAGGCGLIHDDPPDVLIVGDSVTVLSEKPLRERFTWAGDVDIRATSGLRTDELLPGARAGARHDPDIGVFMPGYNDVLQERVDDPALVDMVDLSAQLPCAVWFLLPIDGGYSPTQVRIWNARVKKLAAMHHNLHVSGSWKALVERSPDYTFIKHVDAVHPNHEGQAAIAKAMSDAARQDCT